MQVRITVKNAKKPLRNIFIRIYTEAIWKANMAQQAVFCFYFIDEASKSILEIAINYWLFCE